MRVFSGDVGDAVDVATATRARACFAQNASCGIDFRCVLPCGGVGGERVRDRTVPCGRGVYVRNAARFSAQGRAASMGSMMVTMVMMVPYHCARRARAHPLRSVCVCFRVRVCVNRKSLTCLCMCVCWHRTCCATENNTLSHAALHTHTHTAAVHCFYYLFRIIVRAASV